MLSPNILDLQLGAFASPKDSSRLFLLHNEHTLLRVVDQTSKRSISTCTQACLHATFFYLSDGHLLNVNVKYY